MPGQMPQQLLQVLLSCLGWCVIGLQEVIHRHLKHLLQRCLVLLAGQLAGRPRCLLLLQQPLRAGGVAPGCSNSSSKPCCLQCCSCVILCPRLGMLPAWWESLPVHRCAACCATCCCCLLVLELGALSRGDSRHIPSWWLVHGFLAVLWCASCG
jgi:hypothetical protein